MSRPAGERWLALGLGLAAALLTGCPRLAPAALARPSPRASTPAEALTLWRASRPERFKMVHEVAASHGDQAHVMTGYMLGRKDGSFRVSATAAIGPRVFDVAKVRGEWQAKIHLAQVAEQVDPRQVGEAIDRVYFVECTEGGEAVGDRYVYRCPLSGDAAFDALEMELDAGYLAPVVKRFLKNGQVELTITYREFQPGGPEWMAGRIELRHRKDYRLDIVLVEYVREFAFEDATLHVK